MSTKYLDYDGLLYFWQKIKTIFAPIASPTFTGTPTGPTATAGDSSTQLATTAFVQSAITSSSGEENQNAFSNVKVGSTTIAADAKTDTLELVAGSNVTLTPDATNDKVTIAATNTTYSDFVGATNAAAGTHGLVPALGQKTSGEGFYFLEGSKNTYGSGSQWFQPSIGFDTNPSTNLRRVKLIGNYRDSANVYLVSSADIPYASVSDSGFMSSTDKVKLDSIVMTNGVIDSSVLPSFVDDVIEAYPRTSQTELGSTWLATESASGPVITPETGKIYVLMADSANYAANTQFRWGGTAYVKLADGGVSSITNAEIDVIVAS